MSQDTLDLVVRGLRQESTNVMSLELALPDGSALPEWQPGAHLEVVLPSGLVRHYSLCSDPRNLQKYRLAVLRETGGRGGSEELHSQTPLGTKLTARGPRNHFKVEDGASHYLLIAGGIGITPILAMARELMAAGKSTRLVYCGSSRQTMAFTDELQDIMGDSPGTSAAGPTCSPKSRTPRPEQPSTRADRNGSWPTSKTSPKTHSVPTPSMPNCSPPPRHRPAPGTQRKQQQTDLLRLSSGNPAAP